MQHEPQSLDASYVHRVKCIEFIRWWAKRKEKKVSKMIQMKYENTVSWLPYSSKSSISNANAREHSVMIMVFVLRLCLCRSRAASMHRSAHTAGSRLSVFTIFHISSLDSIWSHFSFARPCGADRTHLHAAVFASVSNQQSKISHFPQQCLCLKNSRILFFSFFFCRSTSYRYLSLPSVMWFDVIFNSWLAIRRSSCMFR